MPPRKDKQRSESSASDAVEATSGFITKDQLDQAISRAIAAANQSLANDLNIAFDAKLKTVQDDTAKLRADHEILQGTVHDMQVELEAAKEMNERQNQLIENQSDTIKALTKRLDNCIRLANRNEQYSRRSSVRITGLKVEANESPQIAATKLMRQSLHMDIKDGDIDIVHFLKRNNPQVNSADGEPSPEPIYIKFARRGPRDAVLMRRKQLKGSGVGVHEDLTRMNHELINRLKKHPDIANVWSWDCKVYGKTRQDNLKIMFEPLDNISDKIADRRAKNAAVEVTD